MAGHTQLQQLSRMVSEGSSLQGYIEEGAGPTVVSSGLPSLDRLLRYRGVRLGTLMEWLESDDKSVESASGATTFALAVAMHLQNTNALTGCRPVVLVDRGRSFYPPSVMPWLEQSVQVTSVKNYSPIRNRHSRGNVITGREEHLLYIVYPANEADEFWSIDQLLRCPSVAAVVGWPKNVSSTVMRRWQMAAKSSGAVGLPCSSKQMSVCSIVQDVWSRSVSTILRSLDSFSRLHADASWWSMGRSDYRA